jgi:hypothetical protein
MVLEFFEKGSCRRLIEEIPVWIKMMIAERGMMQSPVEMES